MWVDADVEECWNKKARGPIGVRWVDVDKGFGVYRSRLVAKDTKPKSKVNDQEGLFAATPPLELVKMLILNAARGSRNGHAGVRKVMFFDVSKTHLYAPMLDEEFVQLPPERWTEGKCARLIYTLNGMRTAASNWEKEYSNTLEMVGSCPGRATAVAFYHAEREVRIVVHGDDFVVEGRQSDLEWFRDVLAAKYILKVRGILGPEQGDRKASWYWSGSWTGAQINSGGKLIRGMSREFCRCVEWFQEIRRSFQESSCRRMMGVRRSLLERI